MAESSSAFVNPQEGEASTVAAPDASAATSGNREEVASKLVERFALWSGVAGLVPVPVIDVIAVAGIQLQMLRRISQIYDVPFTENSGKAVLASLAGTMIPTTSGIGAASMLKTVPIAGMLASAFVMPALSAGATYAIGKVFVQHFASGGTLLDFNPPDYREFIKSQKELWDSRSKSSGAHPSTPGTSEAATSSS
jgi:uncharacterized protein (DUF697 family)